MEVAWSSSNELSCGAYHLQWVRIAEDTFLGLDSYENSRVVSYSPLTGTFSVEEDALEHPGDAGYGSDAVSLQAVSVLPDGRILATGGFDEDGYEFILDAYIGTYSGGELSWVSSTPLPGGVADDFAYHAQTVLADGRIFITRGNGGFDWGDCYLGTVSGDVISWVSASGTPPAFSEEHGSLPADDEKQSSVLLDDGRVLVMFSTDDAALATISGTTVTWEWATVSRLVKVVFGEDVFWLPGPKWTFPCLSERAGGLYLSSFRPHGAFATRSQETAFATVTGNAVAITALDDLLDSSDSDTSEHGEGSFRAAILPLSDGKLLAAYGKKVGSSRYQVFDLGEVADEGTTVSSAGSATITTEAAGESAVGIGAAGASAIAVSANAVTDQRSPSTLLGLAASAFAAVPGVGSAAINVAAAGVAAVVVPSAGYVTLYTIARARAAFEKRARGVAACKITAKGAHASQASSAGRSAFGVNATGKGARVFSSAGAAMITTYSVGAGGATHAATGAAELGVSATGSADSASDAEGLAGIAINAYGAGAYSYREPLPHINADQFSFVRTPTSQISIEEFA